jgi:hypothetical protein
LGGRMRILRGARSLSNIDISDWERLALSK